MEDDLKSLRIDRSKKQGGEPSPWATRWIIAGILVFALAGAGRFLYSKMNTVTEVETQRVRTPRVTTGSARDGEHLTILNATGYIIAAHKIELASKVIGKVAWIGVEKGDRVRQGQILVRLEDDEYKAHVLEAQGQLANAKARLAELANGSRPEEIARAKADLDQAKADLDNAKVTLERTRQLVTAKVGPAQNLDDAQARYEQAVAKVQSLDRVYELVRLGPRHEQVDAARALVQQLQGTADYSQTQLDNTVIRAPISGTVLERNVEKGEFVTTGFVGDKGAKGYVVSLADLNDLQVELDINQNDFGKLSPTQPGVVTTDAFPDRKYKGYIQEVSPEANRQKATVQVKVKIVNPDQFLRPEMNASVAFFSEGKPGSAGETAKPLVTVPATAIRGNTVFIVVNGQAVRRAVKVAGTTASGVQVEGGLLGGEDLIVNPPPDLKEGQKVRGKGV